MTENSNSKFNWRAFFFPAAYFAGKGQVGKGVFLAILGSIPVVFFFVPFWAGFKAKSLPLENTTFSWPKAVGVFLLHGFLLINVMNAIDSGKKAKKKESKKAMTVEELCQGIVNEMNPLIDRYRNLTLESNERLNKKMYSMSEDDKKYFKSTQEESERLLRTIGGDSMAEYRKLGCEAKGFKLAAFE